MNPIIRKLSPEDRAALIEGARLANPGPDNSFMDENEWKVFRRRVNVHVQEEASKSFSNPKKA